MIARVFVDTNVFVYARQASEPLKQAVALEWLEKLWSEGSGRTSVQVLNECYAALTRKARPTEAAPDAWDYTRTLIEWNPLPLDADLALRARALEERYRLNWWDCLIVAAAQAQCCPVLLTEDLQHRATYGSVTVRNPFAAVVCDSEVPPVYGMDAVAQLRWRWYREGISLRPRGRSTQVGL